MAIPEGYKENLEVLKRAAANGDLAIVECQDKKTKEPTFVICAVSHEEGEYQIVPIARMFDDNPYTLLNPPDPKGGFIDTGSKDDTWVTPVERREKKRPKGPEDYQIVDGIFFHKETQREVIDALISARGVIRVHYGYAQADSPETGVDWMDENDVQGRLGRSCGSIKIPLLVPVGEDGAPAMLDHCIVRIRTIGKNPHEIYRHPKYTWGKLTMGPVKDEDYVEAVYHNGTLHAQFKKAGDAERWAQLNGWRIE